MFADLGQHERSVEYYAKAAELDPDDAITLYNWGSGLFKLDRLQECIVIFESPADIDPTVETLLNLTVAYGRSGQLDQARAAFRACARVGSAASAGTRYCTDDTALNPHRPWRLSQK
jgi:tetratricopeptide (TPR) repeat protein